ncbi:MAG TPA: D-alanine--D-alanine ligase [Flavobacteriales bacterium]|nr:D-alanine--D-alanine ligase [Flavobacteriales bacterium]|tara:strand:- start:30632 stop:31597 length:966 start_codon:yes stop_codon:yes gene_type:complete
MLNVAILCGGDSSEYEISLKSAQTVLDNLPKEKYNAFLVVCKTGSWKVNEQFEIDKTDFSFTDDTGKKTKFDFAYITIHGTPGEDGKMQGYLDMLNIPYNTPSQWASTVTFNKWTTTTLLKSIGIKAAKSILLHKNQSFDYQHIEKEIGFPCFVKPNAAGSSFGVSKVNSLQDLPDAISKAFAESNEVLVESFMKGREVTCGCFSDGKKIHTLPVTEIISDNDFFDYDAKYHGKSKEVTPADIPQDIFSSVQETTKFIYQALNLKGVIRIDYILQNNEPWVIEINTTPGLSAQSIIPQQVKAYGMNLSDFFDSIINVNLNP